jgi:hypothetical protein
MCQTAFDLHVHEKCVQPKMKCLFAFIVVVGPLLKSRIGIENVRLVFRFCKKFEFCVFGQEQRRVYVETHVSISFAGWM